MVIHDLATISIDGKFVIFLDRTAHQHQNDIALNCESDNDCTLRIMVEAMGHINYDISMEEDFKGLVSFDAGTNEEFEWVMYKIPIDMDISKW